MPSQLRSLFPALALLALSTLNSQLSTASAQGTAFSYSGQLQVGGVPVTGLYDFQFSLSNAPSGGGSQVGNAVVVSALGVTNGLFSTTMDFGPVFSNSPTWLAIGVRPAGSLTFTNLTPLQQILPTPYAVYAETAGYATVLANGVALGTGQGNAIDPSAVNSFIGGGGENQIQGAADSSVIAGGGNNFVEYNAYDSFIGSGNANYVQTNAFYSAIVGGEYNYIEPGANNSFIGDGASNLIETNATYAVIGGGQANDIMAGSTLAFIGGGTDNQIQGGDQGAVIGGGQNNIIQISGFYSFIGGGVNNTIHAGAQNSVIIGGQANSIQTQAAFAAIGGGSGNIASGDFGTVPGGSQNVAAAYAFAAGTDALATNQGAFVWADVEDVYFTSTNNNSFNVRANGGVRFVTGGAGMTIDGVPVSTGGGTGGQGNPTFSSTVTAPNFVSDSSGDFIAGVNNTASSGDATVAGGDENTASGQFATVGGGNGNTASGLGDFIGGGGYVQNGFQFGNQASGEFSVVAGGLNNQANNNYATVPGGEANLAGGQYSFAAGFNAQATNDGAFVWADDELAPFNSTAKNQFSVRASGGVVFVTGGAGMTIDGQPVATTLSGGALSAPVTITGTTQTAAPNISYVATSASLTTVNLPTAANVGDVVQVSGTGAGGWQVAGNIDGTQGFIWTTQPGAPSANWSSVASSADGSHLVAVVYGGQIYTSANSGVTWAAQTSGLPGAANWSSVASSADGTHLVAVVYGGQIYTSANSGVTWAAQTGGLSANGFWNSVASSADGTHLAAASSPVYGTGEIYTSSNSGVTWTRTAAPDVGWGTVASSADGTHLIAAVHYVGQVYTSADSGGTWVAASTGLPNLEQEWTAVASSTDGTHLIAVAGGPGTQIYTSSDSGTTWTANTSPLESWQCVASSADGTHLVAVGAGGVYTSADSAVSWTAQNSAPTGITSITSSGDGTHLVAVASGGSIYTGIATPGTVSGSLGASEQFQYIGGGVWQPVQANGTWLLSGTNLYYNVGNIGIGTSAPICPLQVVCYGSGYFGENPGNVFEADIRALDGSAQLFQVDLNGNCTMAGNCTNNGGLNLDQNNQNSGTLASSALTFGRTSGEGIASERGYYGTQNDLEFYTDNNIRLEILNNGNVGINTTSPQQSLSVVGGLNLDQSDQNTGTAHSDALTFGSASGEGIASDRANSGTQYDLEFYTAFNNRMEILNNGNVGIGTSTPAYPLDVAGSVNASGSVYANGVQLTSDRNAKENFAPISSTEVLAKVAALPITEWNYKTDSKDIQHIGPMAQDFQAAFGLDGADEKHISVVDEGGVALAAIQGLNQKLEETRAESKAKDAEIEMLKAKADKVDLLEKQLNELKQMVQLLAQQK